MQQAIPYRSWQPLITPTNANTTHFTISPHTLVTFSTVSTTELSLKDDIGSEPNNNIHNSDNPFFVSSKMVPNMVLESAIIVFARRGCCMSHVVKRLLPEFCALNLCLSNFVHVMKHTNSVINDVDDTILLPDCTRSVSCRGHFPSLSSFWL